MELQHGSGLANASPCYVLIPRLGGIPKFHQVSSSGFMAIASRILLYRWLVRRGHQSMVVSRVPMAPARGRSRLMWSMGFIRSWPMLLSPWAKSAALLLLSPWAD